MQRFWISSMRRWLTTLIVVLACAPRVHTQTPTVIGGLDSVAWEHSDADLLAALVTRFEICYDASVPCTTVTPTAAKFTPTSTQGGAPAVGSSAYKLLIPALTTGSHTVTVKACNVSACTSAAPLAFLLQVAPQTPTNARFIKGT